MNKKQTLSRSRTIRFRRWSRKAYAAFASIGICVSIGQVGKSIAECSLRKQATPGSAAPGTTPEREETLRDEADANTPTEWQELPEMRWLQPQTEAVVTPADVASFIDIPPCEVAPLCAGGQPLFIPPLSDYNIRL